MAAEDATVAKTDLLAIRFNIPITHQFLLLLHVIRPFGQSMEVIRQRIEFQKKTLCIFITGDEVEEAEGRSNAIIIIICGEFQLPRYR